LTRRFYDLPDGRMSAVHFGPLDQPVRIVHCHANGFNGQSYRAVFEPLGVHTVALDLRGHGMSDLPVPEGDLKNWYIFRDDITTFFDRFIEEPVVLSGHSFGGVSAILATNKIKGKIAGYVGLDAVTISILSRFWAYSAAARNWTRHNMPIARRAGNRRHIFDSHEAAFERYKNRGAFARFPPEVLNDYLTGGLIPHDDGVQLACHPRWEQTVFVAQAHNVFSSAKHLPANTLLLYAGKGAVSTPLSRAQMRLGLKGGEVRYDKSLSHLFPFQEPDVAIAAFKEVLDGLG